jgi:hypothetical protein
LTYTIDRFEDGGWAVLEGEDGKVFDLPRELLPKEAEAGDVIALEAAYGEELSVLVLRLDRDATETRLEASRSVLERLKGKDPGGDLTL